MFKKNFMWDFTLIHKALLTILVGYKFNYTLIHNFLVHVDSCL